MKRLISLFIVFSFIFPLFAHPASAFMINESLETLGYITSISQELLSYGLVYTELSAEKDKNQKAYIFEYTPNSYTKPQVVYPDTSSKKIRLKDVTSLYEKNGIRVVGAMNGDFFSLQTGIPMGVVIKDGILISSDPSKNAIGFYESGEAIIGNPEIHFTFSYTPETTEISVTEQDENTQEVPSENGDESSTEDVTPSSDGFSGKEDTGNEVREPYAISLDYLNKYPSIYAIYFISDAYSKTTRSTSPSTEVVLKPISGEMRATEDMTFEVVEIRKSVVDGEIPEGHFILCGDDKSYAKDLEVIKKGDILNLEISANEEWKDVETALGGGDIILRDGEIIEDVIDEAHEKLRNPRTAIGVTVEGNVVFFANDGRDSKNAAGVNLKTLAEIMGELGCITAINLDGGGSTTVYATTPFDASAKLVNNPSDGSERLISNAILFLNNMPDSDKVGGIKISSESEFIMLGSSVELSPVYHNKSYRPFTPDSEPIFYEKYGNNGARGVFENNVFTALKGGYTSLVAENDGVKGMLDITVLTSPDEFVFSEKELVLEINTDIPLDISAIWNGKKIIFNNYDALNYRFKEKNFSGDEAENELVASPSVGYIENNTFYATDYFEGFLEISMGDVYAEIPLKITPQKYCDDFTIDTIYPENKELFSFTEKNDTEYLGKTFFSAYVTDISDVPDEKAETITDAGSTDDSENDETSENVKVPEELTKNTEDDIENENTTQEELPEPFTLITSDDIITEGTKSISFLTQGNPEAFVVITDKDGNDMSFPYFIARDYSIYNGWKMYSADLSSLSFENDEKYKIKHLFTSSAESLPLTLGDFRKNYGEELMYTDIEDSWAKEHIKDVYYQELMNGKPYYTAKLFDGSASLTRAEFATVLCRFLGIDLTEYTEQPLDFADINTVGEWAWNQIRAVNELGIMSGSTEDDGNRYFRPQDGITRAEAMQVIGRLLKDAENAAPPSFTDSEAIPSWALDNVAKVVSHGIISGYEDGSIRPQGKLTRNEAAKIFSLFNTESYNSLLNK